MEGAAGNTEETKQEAFPQIRAPSHEKRQSRSQRPLVTFQVFSLITICNMYNVYNYYNLIYTPNAPTQYIRKRK